MDSDRTHTQQGHRRTITETAAHADTMAMAILDNPQVYWDYGTKGD